MDTEPPLRYVTGSLHVDYLRPTPIDAQLTVRARVKEISGRKVVVASTLLADGVETAHGETVCVRMPDAWVER
jgi:acyl-CoA thioesterase FadM